MMEKNFSFKLNNVDEEYKLAVNTADDEVILQTFKFDQILAELLKYVKNVFYFVAWPSQCLPSSNCQNYFIKYNFSLSDNKYIYLALEINHYFNR